MKRPAAAKTLPENPYLAGRREWTERYADHIKAANNWRMVALASLAIAVIAVFGVVWHSGQYKVVPYAIEVDGHGEVRNVARASVATQPTNNQVRAALRNWVIGARTVYVDRRAQQSILDASYAMTLPESAAFNTLSSFHRESNPYQRAGRETVEVAVNTVMPISDETWRVEWTETVKQRSGKVIDTTQMQATITVVTIPPTTERQIMANPLGIYARQFAWAPRL